MIRRLVLNSKHCISDTSVGVRTEKKVVKKYQYLAIYSICSGLIYVVFIF